MKLLEWFVRLYIRKNLKLKLGREVSSYLNYLIQDEYLRDYKRIDESIKNRRKLCQSGN